MTRSTPLAALAAALFLVAAVAPAVPDDSSLPAEIERLRKQMELQSQQQSLIRKLSTDALKLARSKVLLALKNTTLWRRYQSAKKESEAGWEDLAVELTILREQFELELFRQRMKDDLIAILKRPITEDDINRLYADAAARLRR